jgi:hypothetical protein
MGFSCFRREIYRGSQRHAPSTRPLPPCDILSSDLQRVWSELTNFQKSFHRRCIGSTSRNDRTAGSRSAMQCRGWVKLYRLLCLNSGVKQLFAFGPNTDIPPAQNLIELKVDHRRHPLSVGDRKLDV